MSISKSNKIREMQGISAHLEHLEPKWRKTEATGSYNDENICKNSSIAIKHKDIDKSVYNEVNKNYTHNKQGVEI